MKLGVLLAGRRPEDIAPRLAVARDAGFSLCQLNLQQTGITRSQLIEIADNMLEQGIRPVALGCYVNPVKAAEPSFMGAALSDLEVVLHALDVVGARRVVFFSGTHAATPYGHDPANDSDESLAGLREFVIEVVRNTRARHYTLVLEPWYTHVLNSEERIAAFHQTLDPGVAGHVRYVLDAVALLAPDRYAERDHHMRSICRGVGENAGLVHLRDVVMEPDGEHAMPAPGQGRLDYGAYLESIFQYATGDVPAVVRNVPPDEMGAVRDYLLRASDKWQLA